MITSGSDDRTVLIQKLAASTTVNNKDRDECP